MLVSLKALLRLTLLTLLSLDTLQANVNVADVLVTLQETAGCMERPASVMTAAVKTWRAWSAEVVTNLSALYLLHADYFACPFSLFIPFKISVQKKLRNIPLHLKAI